MSRYLSIPFKDNNFIKDIKFLKPLSSSEWKSLSTAYRYTLRGKVRDEVGGAKLSFELEVCRVPRLDVVGIRRKRLKGDAWIYKRVCEEVLRLAQSSSSNNNTPPPPVITVATVTC